MDVFRLMFLGLLGLLAATGTACAQEKAETDAPFSARVTWVVDGDTLKVERKGEQLVIRLAGIDCPEQDQPYGRQAKQWAIRNFKNRTVKVHPHERDDYGRLVAFVKVENGQDLSEQLLKEGLAWWYRRHFPDDQRLESLESEAKAAKRGLWSDPDAVAPWEFKRRQRDDRREDRSAQ